MRRALLGVLATVVVLSVSTTTAFAAGHRGGRYFVDKNSDGICDNANSVCIYVDADADGICDVCSTNHGGCLTGDGTAFVDADGDGICDNYASGQGRGCGRGFRGGRGR